MTRPKTRTPQQARELDDLEELGDDAIIAQETAAHALQPRATVSDESRSVVISDHSRRRDTQPPSAAFLGSTGEATLVIRDRRALDELRKHIAKRPIDKNQGKRALYMWCALGFTAFVLGGAVALLATDSRAAAPAMADSVLSNGRPAAGVAAPAPQLAAPAPALKDAPHAVRLDDLPLEPPHKR